MPGNDDERIEERERTTIEEAREQGTGDQEAGRDPAVPSYTDPGGVSDLGVDEPVVPREERGRKPLPAPRGPYEER